MCTRISNSFSPYLLPSCAPVIFTDMNNYILTEGRNSKTFWEENYAVALDSCCLCTKKLLNMELNMMLVVLMQFACIRHS